MERRSDEHDPQHLEYLEEPVSQSTLTQSKPIWRQSQFNEPCTFQSFTPGRKTLKWRLRWLINTSCGKSLIIRASEIPARLIFSLHYLILARILLGLARNPFFPPCSNFPFTDPPLCNLAINSLFSLLYSWLSSVLYWGLFSPISIAFLNETSFYRFNYCPALVFQTGPN